MKEAETQTLIAPDPTEPKPLVTPGHTLASVTDQISDVVLKRPVTIGWLLGFAFTFSLVMLLVTSIGYLIVRGVGIWGIDIPVAWGFA
ncbi:MAG: NrfD/PsrC family molybdoenzyme membrane anchor subunit, partial [Tepidisphaeraceae bacterium]